MNASLQMPETGLRLTDPVDYSYKNRPDPDNTNFCATKRLRVYTYGPGGGWPQRATLPDTW
jgi:hypothetical protein